MTSSVVYAVHKGRKTGLFFHWDGEGGCKEQVHEYPNAIYKKFKNIPKAKEFVKEGRKSSKPSKPSKARDEYFQVPANCMRDETKEPLVVYVDGSAKKDPNGIMRGGYGVWFGENDKRNVKEKFPLPDHTNNRCEIMAARRAIELVNQNKYIDEDTELIIATDSMYVINAMKCGCNWKGGSVKNQGLLKSLYSLTQQRPVSFLYVPGHTGIQGNEGADRLAKEGTEITP